MFSNDYDLKASEIQQLASAKALAVLFTAFGYDTSQHIPQTTGAMGFPEALVRSS